MFNFLKRNILSDKDNKWLRYFVIAIVEILLVLIGILLAVRIDANITKGKDDKTRCEYLEDLLFVMEEDIEDVEGNLKAFEKWNPIIREVAIASYNNKLSTLDSLYFKLGTVGNYIHFGQGSKSKIDELKYASINLLNDRALKNKVLKYQNVYVSFLRDREKRYDLIGEDLRQYYTKNFQGFNYGNAKPHDLKKLEQDQEYFSLVEQRYGWNESLRKNYEHLLKEQTEIKTMIIAEQEKSCSKN